MRSFALLAVSAALSAPAQTLVSQLPQQRTVLLEEFSAVNCGNCPIGYAQAASLSAAYPGRVVAVEAHGGGLAEPSVGQPDFRNASSSALWDHFNVLSQPRALVGRSTFNGQLVLGTSAWPPAVDQVLAEASPVNIGLSSTFDPGPRMLTVNVELFYSANSPGGNDRIAVLLKESHIIGYQQDYMNGAHQDFDHLNVLRAYITDLWGDEVTTTSTGSFVQRTYTFTVPEEWDVANCDVVAYVCEYQSTVHQVRSVAADGGFTTGMQEITADQALFAFPVPANDHVVIPVPSGPRPANLEVLDGVGRVVHTSSAANAPVVLNVGSWPAGAYHFRIVQGECMHYGRFVIQR